MHIEGLIEDRAPLPEPAALDAIMADPANRGAVGFLVEAPRQAPRAVRVNVTLPEDVLEAIDRASGNRSRFLADAAREKLRSAA